MLRGTRYVRGITPSLEPRMGGWTTGYVDELTTSMYWLPRCTGYRDGGGNVRQWTWPGEEVPLTEAAAGDPQVAELARGFDAFADRVEMQSLGKSDDRPQEGGIRRVVLERMQELLVDLDQVHRQLAQVAQRGVARSEVGDGDPDT